METTDASPGEITTALPILSRILFVLGLWWKEESGDGKKIRRVVGWVHVSLVTLVCGLNFALSPLIDLLEGEDSQRHDMNSRANVAFYAFGLLTTVAIGSVGAYTLQKGRFERLVSATLTLNSDLLLNRGKLDGEPPSSPAGSAGIGTAEASRILRKCERWGLGLALAVAVLTNMPELFSDKAAWLVVVVMILNTVFCFALITSLFAMFAISRVCARNVQHIREMIESANESSRLHDLRLLQHVYALFQRAKDAVSTLSSDWQVFLSFAVLSFVMFIVFSVADIFEKLSVKGHDVNDYLLDMIILLILVLVLLFISWEVTLLSTQGAMLADAVNDLYLSPAPPQLNTTAEAALWRQELFHIANQLSAPDGAPALGIEVMTVLLTRTWVIRSLYLAASTTFVLMTEAASRSDVSS